MKKKRHIAIVAAVLVTGITLLTMTGCCEQGTDATQQREMAILSMPDGVIVRGTVESWDFTYKTQLKVKIDGITYFVGVQNAVMIKED